MSNQESALKYNLALMVFNHGLRILFPLILFPIISRQVSAESFAEFVLLQTINHSISSIVEFGFAYTAVRQIASSVSKRQESIIIRKVEAAKLTLVIFILLILTLYSIFNYQYLAIFSVLSGCISGMTPYYAAQGKEKFKELTRTELSGISIYYLFSISTIVITKNIDVVIISYFLSRVYVFLKLRFYTEITGSELNKLNFKTLRYLRSNVIYFFQRIASVLYSNYSVFLIGYFATKEELAYYSAAEKIVFVLCGLIIPVQQVLLPHISKKNDSRSVSMTFLIFLILLSFLGCFVLSFNSYTMFDLYYGPSLANAASNFNYLVWLFPLKLLTSLISTIYYLAKGRQLVLSKIFFLITTLYIVSSTMGMLFQGIDSVIASLLVVELVYFILLIGFKNSNEK